MDNPDSLLQVFLHEHLAQCVEKVERLEGGAVNFVFRIHLKNEVASQCPKISNSSSLLSLLHRFKPKTLIAKLALPYMAAYGYAAPLSTTRQIIEKEALQLFHTSFFRSKNVQPNLQNLSSVVTRNKTIRIPRVWFYDPKTHILIMDDHGCLPNMEQLFTFNEEYTRFEQNICLTEVYGEQLGIFVADMQVSSLPMITALRSLLHNPEYEKYLLTEYLPVLEHILDSYNVPDAADLTSIAILNYEYQLSCTGTNENVLTHGDLWPRQFLTDTVNETLDILDWEFACIDSPAADPAHLLAFLRILSHVHPSNKHIIQFMYSFMDAYRETVKKQKNNWYQNDHEQQLFAWSLGITHGYVLIKGTFDQRFCLCKDEKCAHKRTGIALGVDYLRRCRSGPDKTTYDLITHDHILCRLF